jgi:DNA modification methylase
LTKLTHELALRLRAARKVQSHAKKAPTAADKSKASRDAKKYRSKHKQSLKTKAKTAQSKAPSKPTVDPVVKIENTIQDVKTKLTAAVAHQRALMAATKNG